MKVKFYAEKNVQRGQCERYSTLKGWWKFCAEKNVQRSQCEGYSTLN